MSTESLLEVLYRALNTDLGIVIETEDPVRTKQKLYQLRLKHPELTNLSFLTSVFNPTTEILILNKKEADDEP